MAKGLGNMMKQAQQMQQKMARIQKRWPSRRSKPAPVAEWLPWW